jgi:hypothetical protein
MFTWCWNTNKISLAGASEGVKKVVGRNKNHILLQKHKTDAMVKLSANPRERRKRKVLNKTLNGTGIGTGNRIITEREQRPLRYTSDQVS